MSLSLQDLKKIAHLARLSIEEEKALPLYQEDLSRLLNLVDKMSAVDTSAILPMAHPQDVHQRFREDEVTEPDVRDTMQAMAPSPGDVEAGLYLVPRVIDESE